MKLRNSLLLLLTATIWGVAFVAQSVGMQYVGPMTYVCSRSIIGGVVLLPVIAVLNRNSSIHSGETPQERRKGRKILLLGGACCGLILSIASTTQQIALLYIPVGKAGFLTACYILIVPLLGMLFGRKCGLKHWCGVALALLGLYFLCMAGGSFGFAKGDLIGLACALLFSVHILVIDHFSPLVDGVKMACIQFWVCAFVAGVGMLIFEHPTWANILAAWKPILYAGAMSSGVGYTLQIVGQKGMNPAVASLIMSLESVISVIAGWLILGQALSGREIFCADVWRYRAGTAAGTEKTERIMQKTITRLWGCRVLVDGVKMAYPVLGLRTGVGVGMLISESIPPGRTSSAAWKLHPCRRDVAPSYSSAVRSAWYCAWPPVT